MLLVLLMVVAVGTADRVAGPALAAGTLGKIPPLAREEEAVAITMVVEDTEAGDMGSLRHMVGAAAVAMVVKGSPAHGTDDHPHRLEI